jgi:hypothetical protein
MLTNDNKLRVEIRERNQADLLAARTSLLHRTADVSNSFESSLHLVKALMNLLLHDEISGDDACAMTEIVMIVQDTLRAGYSQYLLEDANLSATKM